MVLTGYGLTCLSQLRSLGGMTPPLRTACNKKPRTTLVCGSTRMPQADAKKRQDPVNYARPRSGGGRQPRISTQSRSTDSESVGRKFQSTLQANPGGCCKSRNTRCLSISSREIDSASSAGASSSTQVELEQSLQHVAHSSNPTGNMSVTAVKMCRN